MKDLLLRLIIGKHPRKTLLRAAILAVVCVVVFGFVLRPAWTDGVSMEPTVHNRRLHFINLVSYRFGDPQRYDIVAVRGNGTKFMYLKRILACPGERIAFQNGTLVVDDAPLEEPYVEFGGTWTMDEQTLSGDEYFVAGDNRAQPRKLHTAGITKREFIVGKLL